MPVDSEFDQEPSVATQIRQIAQEFGALDAVAKIADYSLRFLVEVVDSIEVVEPATVDGSIAGRAFRTGEMLVVEEGVTTRYVCPLEDGAHRIGVVEANFDSQVTDPDLAAIADRVLGLIVRRDRVTDVLATSRRVHPLAVAAEMQWALLPPLSASGLNVAVAGMLEPAHTVAGDAFDYAINVGTTCLAAFDAMGHGLQSAMLTAVAVGAYRNARRGGLGLAGTIHRIDGAVGESGTGAFVTAVLAELDTDTGELHWCSAGHPPPLHLRDGRLVDVLEVSPAVPLGIGLLHGDPKLEVVRLQPGDSILLYTDGAVDARTPDGTDVYSMQRLTDLIARSASSGLSTPETLRQLAHSIVDFHGSNLRDDATVMLATWQPGRRI